MPIDDVVELFQSRRSADGDAAFAERLYCTKGTSPEANDDAAVRSAVAAVAPTTMNGLPRETIEVEQLGNDLWMARVRYVDPKQASKVEGESQFNFEIGTGTQKITQALTTRSVTTPTASLATSTFKQAINVKQEGGEVRVEGADVLIPVFNFSETHQKADGDIDTAYIGNVFSLTARVNNAAFKGFTAGEVLFLGASGSRVGDDPWEISYRFAASPNLTSLLIGDITVPAKDGWELLWVQYETAADADLLVKKPKVAVVDRIYETGNFALLEIGT